VPLASPAATLVVEAVRGEIAEQGERFIRPLYWKRPLPRPPAQLEHLHFAFLDLAALSGVAGLSPPPISAAHEQTSDAPTQTIEAEPRTDNHDRR
jgi:hypothetical protein